MEFIYTARFKKSYKKLDQNIKKILRNKLEIMEKNPNHPSLRSKKVQGTGNIFECSINMSVRMTWEYHDNTNNTILLRVVGDHDYVLKNP